MNSITTIASNIFTNPEDSGHLRSGTYDITSRVIKDNSLISKNINEKPNFSIKCKKSYKLNDKTQEKIRNICLENDFTVDPNHLIDFAITAQIERENIKYLFTKDLSYLIELIAEAGEELGFSRDQLSHLDLDILKQSIISTNLEIKKNWTQFIEANKKQQEVSDLVILPDCIFSSLDISLIQYPTAKPNFITNGIVRSEPILIDHDFDISNLNIKDKIILIKSADPGYDWLFSHNIAGLITEYGGIASHMAIRCNEFNIPAALGVGNTLFDKCKSSHEVILDCSTQKLTIN